MATDKVRQMTASTLNALKGWPHPHALDFTARYSTDIPEENLPVVEGAVVHLDDNGEFLLGIGTELKMAMFNFHRSTSHIVNGDGGDPSVDRGVWINFMPAGNALALPAKGAFELVSTAFVAGESYVPNTFLTSDLTGDDAGLIKPGVYGTDTIVGQVSRGLTDNAYGHAAVAFWPDMIYPTPAGP